MVVDRKREKPTDNNVECLHEDEMSIIMKVIREDGSEVYVMRLKKDGLVYGVIFSS